jgi:tetratricopeptide (TPR) repeat protein
MDHFEAALAAAAAASARGDHDGACRLLEPAAAAPDPGHAVLALLGACYAASGRLPLAVAAFVRALQVRPGALVTRVQLALALCGSARGAEARAVLATCVDEPGALGACARGLVLLLDDRLVDAAAELGAGVEGLAANPPLQRDLRRLTAALAEAGGAAVPASEHAFVLAAYSQTVH